MESVRLTPELELRPVTAAKPEKHLALLQRIYPPAFAYLWPDKGAWYLNKVHSREALLADLAEPDAPYFYVFFREQCVGILRLQLHVECPDFPGEPALKLQRLYLDDAVRGCGIGTTLMDYVKAETLRLGKSLLWLERMDTNEATIGFYYKNGFTDEGAFRLPFELMYEEFRGMVRMYWRV